jgi:YD repeat-containing protein
MTFEEGKEAMISMQSQFRLAKTLLVAAIGASSLAVGVAQAQETTSYSYDALGRVTGVSRSGGPVSGTSSAYTYDPASNRTNVTVTNSPNGTSGSDGGSGATASTARYVIIPLNGYTLIRF